MLHHDAKQSRQAVRCAFGAGVDDKDTSPTDELLEPMYEAGLSRECFSDNARVVMLGEGRATLEREWARVLQSVGCRTGGFRAPRTLLEVGRHGRHSRGKEEADHVSPNLDCISMADGHSIGRFRIV